MKVVKGKPSREEEELIRILNNPDGECQAYKDAKAHDSAYIIEDGWIVRVYADDHREKIKYVGETQVEINHKLINTE
jgi:hypothetical protein